MYTYPEAMNALQRVAHDMVRRARPDLAPEGIEVRVAGDTYSGTASVDWNDRDPRYLYVTINMPVRPATYLMSEGEFDHWAAYMLHEVGHPLWTSQKVWREACRTGRQNLLNSLEDVREEKCTIDLGIAVNARRALSALIDTLQAKTVASGYNPNDVRSIGWTLSLMGRLANGYDVDASALTRLRKGGTVERITRWALPALAKCASTQDCLDLADKVTTAVKLAAKPPQKPVQRVQPEKAPELPPQPENASTGSPDGEESPESPAGESDPQGGSMETRGEPDQEPEAEGAAGHGGEGAGVGEPSPKDVADTCTDHSDTIFDKADDMRPNSTGNLTSTDAEGSTQRKLVDAIRKAGDVDAIRRKPITGRDTGGSVATVTDAASKMGRQRALLARALKCEESDDYEGGRLHGRLDRRALARIPTGNPNVFGRRITAEGYDTDVEVLVDGSGSMVGRPILAAASLALVIKQAALQVGVPCTVHLFGENGLQTVSEGKAKTPKHRFAWMYNQADGGTPLTASLIKSATLQKARASARRKVLFVITDGGCNDGPTAVKAAGDYIERCMGIEIANLHIGSQPMGLFRNEVAVSTGKVVDTGLRKLVSVLEAGAVR